MILRTTLILATFLAVGPAAGQLPRVDGQFGEWSERTLLATDPAGDAADGFDVTELHARNNGSQLFVHFDVGSVLNLQAGPQGQGTLRLELGFPGQQLTVDFRNRLAFTGGDQDNFVPWSDLNFVSLSTYAADRFELRIDVSALGFGTGDAVSIDFSGSDTLANPVVFDLESPAQPPPARSAQREPCTTLRIANLNTLFGGLLDPDRQEAVGRLVQAAAADIYCFQEQNSPAGDIAERLQELNPLGDGAVWNVHTSGDTVIASPLPVIAIPHPGDAAAVVDMGPAGVLVVFSIHPPCCGYIGSRQDQGRIEEMMEVAATVDDLRNAALGPDLAPYRYAPVLIAGDWNLVGSRTPLTIAEEPAGLDQTHCLLPHLGAEDVLTWRDLNESPNDFSPGLLDLLTYQAGLLFPKNGFVLDSTELDPMQLVELGLLFDDSLATDHLMLVGDFSTAAGGDVNGDGTVDSFDLATVLGHWGPCPLCPEDLNGDGAVNAPDLAKVLGSWGRCSE